jgi:hypothetical protein
MYLRKKDFETNTIKEKIRKIGKKIQEMEKEEQVRTERSKMSLVLKKMVSK